MNFKAPVTSTLLDGKTDHGNRFGTAWSCGRENMHFDLSTGLILVLLEGLCNIILS